MRSAACFPHPLFISPSLSLPPSFPISFCLPLLSPSPLPPQRTYIFTLLLSSRVFIHPYELMSKVCHLCVEHQRLSDPQADKVLSPSTPTAHSSTPIYNTAPQHHTTALQYTIQHLDITLQHSNMENPQITPQHLNVQYSTLESQHSAPACCSTAMYSTGSAKVTLQYPILPQSSQVPLKVESNPINIV